MVLDTGNRSKGTKKAHPGHVQAEMPKAEILSIPRFRKSKALAEESRSEPGPTAKIQACFTLLGLAVVPADNAEQYRRVGLLKTCVHYDEDMTKDPNFDPLEHLPHPWHLAQKETFTLV
jgi:hypothetical protein